MFVKNEEDMRYLWCIVKSFENDTNTDVPLAKVQNYLLCDSDQAISRAIQWNKLFELLDRKSFEKRMIQTRMFH